MNYPETLEYLYARLPMFQRQGAAAYKSDLTNTIQFCSALGNPEKSQKFIHVAGTNGKGSVSHMLAAVFQLHGYKTGLYTSPHLIDFKERIKVNGTCISENEVVEFVDRHQDTIEGISPSFFECTVAMAFDHFQRHKCDISIIETGLGGRLDSTNVIMPELSIITNIGFDHMDLLGNTLELIAKEKAGIIKPGIPVLIGEFQQEVSEVFEEKGSPLHYAIDFEVSPEDCDCDLKGAYQINNIRTVLAAIELLKHQYPLKDDLVRLALRNVSESTGLRGRWETLGRDPLVVCDTAHNLPGIEKLIPQIMSVPCARLHIVWGMVKEKDTGKIWPLLPDKAEYYFCSPSIPRGRPADELAGEANLHGLQGSVYQDVPSAYRAALNKANTDDFIFVGGSTFVVADVLTYIDSLD